MKAKKEMLESKGVCKHCGGVVRAYRGSTSCLMCGRDEKHECEMCCGESLRKTA
ncbi:hypothetical protein MNBD_NITROSPINAE01-1648 [hydrothermal vent metagenome]|uniref:Uncharacterized protein n=1 Tax=hydrothermal vent metagenome TaxID=652676 RepID=A0A3B1BKF0_9ZZZZ